MGRRLLLPIILAALIGSGATRADGQSGGVAPGNEVIELRKRVLSEGGIQAEQAAIELFRMGDEQHEFLFGILRAADEGSREARLAILRALRGAGRERPQEACRMAFESLADPVKAVADQGKEVFGALEDDRDTAYKFIRSRLAQGGDPGPRPTPDTPRARQALALIDVLERHMYNQIKATGVLLGVLREFPSSELETRVRSALRRMTSCGFQDVRAWEKWYEEITARCGGSLALWRAEIAAEKDKTLARYEDEALATFVRLLERIAQQSDSEAAVLRELTDTLRRESVPRVRQLALQRLGDLAARKNPAAVAELRNRLRSGGDDAQQAVLELARAEDPALLPDILPWIGDSQPVPMRLASIAALSRLKAVGAVEPLIELVSSQRTADEVRDAAVVALGKIGQNPEGRVSRALVNLGSGLLPQNGNGGGAIPGSTPVLLKVADALSLLPFPADGPDTQQAVTFLKRIGSDVEDNSVRSYAVSALGKLAPEEAFQFLLRRSEAGQEPVVRVRRAILEALGQQALDRKERRPAAIRRLVAFVDDPEKLLQDNSRLYLERLADPRVDPVLETKKLIVDELAASRPKGESAWHGLAARFLEALPEPARWAELPAPQRPDYERLLEIRARGRIQNKDYKKAVEDLRGLLGIAGGSGAQRAELVFGLALQCLPRGNPDPGGLDAAAGAWSLVLDAAEALKLADKDKLTREHLDQLEQLQQSIPEGELKERLKSLRNGVG